MNADVFALLTLLLCLLSVCNLLSGALFSIESFITAEEDVHLSSLVADPTCFIMLRLRVDCYLFRYKLLLSSGLEADVKLR